MSTNQTEERLLLETVDLVKQYHQYDAVITAVNRANLKVYEGQFVCIIGSSGSGKSTLLHICAGLDMPNNGRVVIRGRNLTAMSPDELVEQRYRHFRDVKYFEEDKS